MGRAMEAPDCAVDSRSGYWAAVWFRSDIPTGESDPIASPRYDRHHHLSQLL